MSPLSPTWRRVAAFEAVRTAIGSDTGPVDAARRDAAIAAALDAFVPAGTHSAPDEGAAPPATSLAEARRRARLRRHAVLAAAAAAAVLAAVVVPILASRGDHPNHAVVVAAPNRSPTAAGSTGAAKTAAPTTPSAEASTAARVPEPARPSAVLGPFTDLDALASAARDRLAPAPASTPASTTTSPTPSDLAPATAATSSSTLDPPTQACIDAGQQAAAGRGQVVLLTGTASISGRPVVVIVTRDPQDRRTLTATDPSAGCAVVGTRAL